MRVVDTNVLVHAVNLAAPEHARCFALLESLRPGREPWGTTWGVLYEFLRVVTHPRILPTPVTSDRAFAIVEALRASPAFQILVESERHAEVARRTLDEVPLLAGNVLHDFHTAVVMREHGVRRIYTRDTDFHRFPFLEVIDPMTTG